MSRGIEVILDQWDLALGQDIAGFMDNSVATADRVLLVCSDPYVTKADAGAGGVGYERLVISAEVVAQIDTKKFVPIVRNAGDRKIPRFLGPRRYQDFSDDSSYGSMLEDLARELHGVPALAKPQVGPNPYAATLPTATGASRLASPSGLLPTGLPILGESWFEERAAEADIGIRKLGLGGCIEMRFALHEGVRKSQLDLLSAVRDSQVPTFGWPIGIVSENVLEYKPKPFGDGVRTEVAIAEGLLDGKPSYDFWAARNNGDFYVLQSFFEDSRAERKLFFNTRIVRAAEGLMFAAKYYETLGISSQARISIAFKHQGLSGRTLSSSNPNRSVWPRTAVEDRAEVEVVDSLAGLRTSIVDHVINIMTPTFMLFDFATFERRVYDDIVTSFTKGRVT